MKRIIVIMAAASLAAAPVHAERRVRMEPLPQEGTSIRYQQGVATVDLRREHGAVQITPLGLDHGRLTFGVSVMNLGESSDNFGVEDISLSVRGQTFAVLTRERLDRLARRRAAWTQFGIALLSGAAGLAAANSRDTYRATTYTPRGTYRTIIRGPSAGGQAAAVASVAAGGYAIHQVQEQLDATRAALAEEIVQTTTVDPGDSYGGRFVVDEIRGRNLRWPQDVTVTVNFNGEAYSFPFRVTREQ